MFSGSGMFGRFVSNTSPLQVFIRMFLVSFVTLLAGKFLHPFLEKLWQKNQLPFGRKYLAKSLLKPYSMERSELLVKVEQLLDLRILRETPLPKDVLNTKSMAYLIQVLEKKEARNMSEALQMLALDSQNQTAHDQLTESENAIFKAKQFLA
jgi:hypothetical protein